MEGREEEDRRSSTRCWLTNGILTIAALLLAALLPLLSAPVWANDPTVTVSKGERETVLTDGDPINMATGEFFFILDLLQLGGPLPLDYRLYYGSQVDSKRFHEGMPRSFSSNRRGTLSWASANYADQVYLETGLGNELVFTGTGGLWQVAGFSDVRYQLKETNDAFYLMDPSRRLVSTYLKQQTAALTGTVTLKDRLSTDSSGQAGNGTSQYPKVTADGRYVVFQSAATNLVNGDTNGVDDVFLKDRQTGQTTRLSTDSNGTQGDGPSRYPAISADGRYVAFQSDATNVVAGDTNVATDIFVKDRQTGQITRVSVSSSGGEANGASTKPAISGDGRFVAFQSAASNLVSGDTNGIPDVFVHDRQTGQTTRVSVSSTGAEANAWISILDSYNVAVSYDGRFVAFQSRASSLVAGDTNGFLDIFVHDRQTGETSRVSTDASGTQGNGQSQLPSLSWDGRYVAFSSSSSNLVPGDTNGVSDIFVKDRQTGQITRASVDSAGTQADKDSYTSAISGDGRFVAFQSAATNLVPSDTNAFDDVFLHDWQLHQTIRASVSITGAQGTFQSSNPQVAPFGRWVVFDSNANNLVFGDTANTDVFVAERVMADKAFLRRVEDRNGNTLTYDNPADPSARGPDRVADGLGRELRFTYATIGVTDTRPYLIRVEDQTGRGIGFRYENAPTDNPGLVTLRGITDTLGNVRTFSYAGRGAGWIASETLPRGNTPYTRTYQTSFTDRGVVAVQTDAYGSATTVGVQQYQPYANVDTRFTITRADGSSRSYVHGHQARVATAMADETGRPIGFASDPTRDQITAVTDRLGYTTAITYHVESGEMAGITNAKGLTQTRSFSATTQTFTNPDTGDQVSFTFYDPTEVGYADGMVERFSYDGRGNVLTRTDQAGNTWSSTYNSRGQVLTSSNPLGGITTFTYNADGTLASRADSDTGAETYSYDALKRLARITRPDGTTVQLTYDDADRITATTDESGRTTTISYDANGNVVQSTDAAGNTTRTEYDLLDRVVRTTDPVSRTTTTVYDALGRPSVISTTSGISTQVGYDVRGWITGVVRAGVLRGAGPDPEGRAVTRTTPSGAVRSVQRDALGFPAAVTDPLSQTTTLTRDAMGRVTAVRDPLGRTTGTAYDALGRVTAITLPVSGTVGYRWDALGNLSRITDLNGQQWSFTSSPMGRLRTTTDPAGRTIANTYDSRGRLTQTTYPDGVSLTRTYSPTGALLRQLYSDGTDLQFSYDALDRLVGTSGLAFSRDAAGRVTGTADGSRRFGATYDDDGRLKTATDESGGLTVTYTYSPATDLLMRVADSVSGASVGFRYDADERLSGITRSNGVTTSLTYDAAGQLTRIQEGAVLDLQYTLDAAGQVTGLDLTAPLDPASVLPPATGAFSYDAASEVSTTGYSYDARGRLTAAPGQTFGWDGASRLTSAAGVTLTYNGNGDLRTRAEGGRTTHFYYNYAIGERPIAAEADETTGQVVRAYVWTPDGTLLYGVDAANGNTPFFYHFDRTGSTLALTDSNGSVTDAYVYTPMGRLLAHQGGSTQSFTFVGRLGVRQEGSRGTLYQMRARYYDVQTARFLSREPIWPTTGEPRAVNPYQYAYDNPVSNVDPGGTSVLGDLGDFVSGLWTTLGYAFSSSGEPKLREYVGPSMSNDYLKRWAEQREQLEREAKTPQKCLPTKPQGRGDTLEKKPPLGSPKCRGKGGKLPGAKPASGFGDPYEYAYYEQIFEMNTGHLITGWPEEPKSAPDSWQYDPELDRWELLDSDRSKSTADTWAHDPSGDRWEPMVPR